MRVIKAPNEKCTQIVQFQSYLSFLTLSDSFLFSMHKLGGIYGVAALDY